MKRKKTFNGYLPRLKVEGTFDNPDYNVILQVPVTMKRDYAKRKIYDCLVDPMEDFFAFLVVASDLLEAEPNVVNCGLTD